MLQTETTEHAWRNEISISVSDDDDAAEGVSSENDALLTADLQEAADEAVLLFSAQRCAREAYFRYLFDHTNWKLMPLGKMDLSGAAAGADNDSRRFHAFVRRAFALAMENEQVAECDLPKRDEIYEYYWLFVFQLEWIAAESDDVGIRQQECQAGEHHRPSKRSHAKALIECVKDCTTPSMRVDRFRQMQDNITGDDKSAWLTASMVKKLGKLLVEKRDAYEHTIRREWRDLSVHTPKQAKVESALDALNSTLGRKDLPDDAAAAIRKALAVFTDNRHLLLVVDDAGVVIGALSRTRHYYGYWEQYRTGVRGKRGGKGSTSRPVHIFAMQNEWRVVDLSREWVNGIPSGADLVEHADDYQKLKQYHSCVPPLDKDDGYLLDSLVVMPNGSQALDQIEAAAQLDLTLKPVLLQTVKKWMARRESPMGRHWEDVADEVYEVIDIQAEDPEPYAVEKLDVLMDDLKSMLNKPEAA